MVIKPEELYFKLSQRFPYEPTSLQDQTLRLLAEFILDKKDSIFLLKGFAGTGKTTIISSLVKTLPFAFKQAVLLAPTGRAAKVITNYSGKEAFTIHKKIYYPKKGKAGGVSFTLQKNKHSNTIFIVDEASMIPDEMTESKLWENGSLLDDLMTFIDGGKQCKLVLIGDTAQLPPVHIEQSPALSADLLNMKFNKQIYETELTEVTRQDINSGILLNATSLRLAMEEEIFQSFRFNLNFPDIINLQTGDDILDAFMSSYSVPGIEDTCLIVRSNKRANSYNEQIRARILDRDSEIATGDHLMVVKNNYYWLQDSNEVSFIANGDICEVMQIYKYIDLYGFRFAEIKLRMIDYPNEPPFDTVIVLDTLKSETPSLTFDQSNQLYQEVAKDYSNFRSKYKVMLAIKENKYFNALQVKFSYAITCHKSQGGQWKNVFIEQPYLPNGQDISYFRWLYTAITRAQEKLFLIGFKDEK
ncbi:MAG: AAA family ATPase [Lutimonas sp.]